MLKTVVIKRSKWIHGTGGDSCLTNGRGKYCVVGFYLRQIGMRVKDLIGRESPGDLILPEEASWLLASRGWFKSHSDICKALIRSNDWPTYTRKEREQRIKAGFATQGLKVRFVP